MKHSHNKLTMIILTLLPLLVVANIVFLISTQKKERNDLGYVETQEVFQTKEPLKFTLKLGPKPTLSLHTTLSIAHADEPSLGTYTEDGLSISAALLNVNEQFTADIPLQITKQDSETFIISSTEEKYNIVPGKYALDVKVETNEGVQNLTQDFNWGVLAVNTNKSIYQPGDTAHIAMAVLDERGEMVCDAEVNLTIINPDGTEYKLSTSEQNIKVNSNCQKKEYIQEPDYETSHQVEKIGTYQMVLTAITENGTYEIRDSFEVRNYVPFDVERTTATRIYPPVDYPVLLNIKANADFNGIIEESIPNVFEVISTNAGFVNREYGTGDNNSRLVQKVAYIPSTHKSKEINNGKQKILRWQVNLKKGEEYQIRYTYRAPQISPEFYLLGPLTFIDRNEIEVFREGRKWQIASDAISFLESTGTSAVGKTSVSATLNIASGNLILVFCMTKNSRTISMNGSGYTNVYTESGTPSQYTWYKIATATGNESITCSWTTNDIAGIIMHEYSGVENYSGYILDTSASATGTGDSTAECPSVTPSSGNHLYVAGLTFNANTNISTWSNSFNEREDRNSGTGAAANRIVQASADKITTGAQSTTATAGANGAWRCHMLAFNENVDYWVGTAYTDDNETTPLGSVSVCGVVDNGTPVCATTNGSGVFTIAGTDGTAGTQLTFYIDGGTYLGNTVTINDGGDIVSGDNLRVYQNHVVLRHEQGTDISIADMDAYDNDQNSTDMLYNATAGSPDTLTVESPAELFVQTGYTFAPTGNVTQSHDIEIDGTWTAAASETVNLSGTYKLDSGGTLSASTSTITFDGTGDTEDLITDGTGNPYNITLNDGGNNLTVEVEDDLVVGNTLTITGGALDAKSGENNQITVNNIWDNDDTFLARNGTVVFAGSSAATYTMDIDGTGTDVFWNLTMNDSGGGATYQAGTAFDIDNDFTIIGGTYNSNGNNTYVGRNWTNDDIFTEGTTTVIFDGDLAGTLDSGCADEDTCTNENFYNIQIDKKNSLTLANTHLRVSNTLTITQGELIQSSLNLRAEGTTAVDVKDFGRWTNTSTGDITLGGNVENGGAITLNANGYSCGENDDITLTSTDTNQRSWSGNGAFRITDVAVQYQTGTAVIHASSSTNTGNNGTNWVFVECNIFEFEGLNFESINID